MVAVYRRVKANPGGPTTFERVEELGELEDECGGCGEKRNPYDYGNPMGVGPSGAGAIGYSSAGPSPATGATAIGPRPSVTPNPRGEVRCPRCGTMFKVNNGGFSVARTRAAATRAKASRGTPLRYQRNQSPVPPVGVKYTRRPIQQNPNAPLDAERRKVGHTLGDYMA